MSTLSKDISLPDGREMCLGLRELITEYVIYIAA